MAAKSDIEWTDSSWTPIRARNVATGKIGWHCEHATTGCEFCYSESMNLRLGTSLPFKPGHRKDVEIFLDEKMLLEPLRWKKPRMIFVCSMTDAFADFVKDEWLDKMFAVMALCPQHTFQVLTKRAERMRDYMTKERKIDYGEIEVTFIDYLAEVALREFSKSALKRCWEWRRGLDDDDADLRRTSLPFPNVWLGVSCERQQEADERIPLLLQTPAAIRFVSAEPLLGPINLKHIKVADLGWQDVLEGWRECKDYPGRENTLDWVIAGGESGRGARRMDARWARVIQHQCAAASVPFFFKQWGEFDAETWDRVGKKAAGRLLDGIEHNAMPNVSANLPSGLPAHKNKQNQDLRG